MSAAKHMIKKKEGNRDLNQVLSQLCGGGLKCRLADVYRPKISFYLNKQIQKNKIKALHGSGNPTKIRKNTTHKHKDTAWKPARSETKPGSMTNKLSKGLLKPGPGDLITAREVMTKITGA